MMTQENQAEALPTNEQVATCRTCNRKIVWLFDTGEDDKLGEQYGFWYEADLMTECCGATEDGWHDPHFPR